MALGRAAPISECAELRELRVFFAQSGSLGTIGDDVNHPVHRALVDDPHARLPPVDG